MNQKIRYDLTQNFISCTYTDHSFHCKQIIQMSFSKSDQTVVTFQQIRYNDIPVIIAVNIKYPKYGIRFMLGKDRHDCIVFSEKQDSGQRNPFLLCLLICQNQSRTAKHFLISHGTPWMAPGPHTSHISRPFH